MNNDWQELTNITQGEAFLVERIRFKRSKVAVEGNFELPPLATLSMEDQTFIAAFLRTHGSIKEMEELFGISYPTVKNRLNHIAGQLEFVEINPPDSKNEVLNQLHQGKISVKDALKKLRGEK